MESALSTGVKRPEFEIPNPDVHAHADQIADAAIFLFTNMPKINCVPSVLLEGALAIELYLKTLASRTIFHPLAGSDVFQLTASPKSRIHFLDGLFDAIDAPIKDELQQAYAAAPVIPGVPLLKDALSRYRNLFVEIRYAFESPDFAGNSITYLINLVRFFKRTIAAMPRRYRAENADD